MALLHISLDTRNGCNSGQTSAGFLEGMYEKDEVGNGQSGVLKCRPGVTIIQGGHAHARWIPCSPLLCMRAQRVDFVGPLHDICSWQAYVRNELARAAFHHVGTRQ